MTDYLADAFLALDDGTLYRYRDGGILTPGSPSPSGVLYGAVEATSFDQLNGLSAITAAGGLKVRRFYEGSWPSAPSSAQTADYARGVIPFVSYSGPSIATINAGSSDSLISGYFAALPSDKTTYVTWIHEVDNGKLGGSSIAQFKTAIARIHGLKQANAPDPSKVLFGPLLMGYAFTMAQAPSGAGYYADYLTGLTALDYVGADPYRFWRPAHSPDLTTVTPNDPKIGGLGTKRSMSYLMSGWETYHAANPSVPLLIGEYSAHPDPANVTDRPDWLQQTHQWFKDNNCIAACYYHSSVGESGPWWLDCFHNFTTKTDQSHTDTNSINTYASLLAGGS
jgi:hypothetical protein